MNDTYYVIIYLAILVIFWRWWTIAILATMSMKDFFPTEGMWVLAVLAMHVIGLIAERIRRKRRKAQASENKQQAEGAPASQHPRTTRFFSWRARTDEDAYSSPDIAGVPVDINTARREELLTLPGIGAAEAGMILKRTQAGQGFGDLEELADYLRLKPHKMVQLRRVARFSAPAASGQPHGGKADDPPAPRKGRVID
ncbi:MAG: helix-hairpin-helix domain-containing protein [Candidatus Accumulibacter sp.]|jgi:DNA uptake protein ComE-like DNA-binding protein|nr:helix-hairpin-helix domain-containing protein [Accumulibacter sp.]